MSRPSIPLTDKRFIYTNACATNIRDTFTRIRREQAEARKVADADTQKVVAIFNDRREKA